MDPSSVFPGPVKCEDMCEVVDLDDVKTPEDRAYEWDSKVRMQFNNYFLVDSERSLDRLMKWYIELIKTEAMDGFEAFESLKVLTAKHIQFFKLYFIELNCCFVDNYLDNMEEILVFYSNLAVQSVPVKKRDESKRVYQKTLSSICRKIISMLNVYLLNKEDRKYHVIMKIKLDSLSEEGKELLNLLYGKLLISEPIDKSDLGFCRAYILFQKWKTIKKPNEWEKMDAVMYKLHDRTSESVKSNKMLSQIIVSQKNSVIDTLNRFNKQHTIFSEKYFKFIKSTRSPEDEQVLPEISDVEIPDQVIPDLGDDSDDGEFDRAYNNFVKAMSNLCQANSDKTSENGVALKEEVEDDDDECQFVSESSLGYDTKSTELVHEILEDDIEIIYFRKKEQQNTAKKDKGKANLSFLDSIDIPDQSDGSTEKVSSSSNTRCLLPQRSKNLVTTSTNTSPDSPMRNPSAQPSKVQTSNSSISTSIIRKQTNSDLTSKSSVTTSMADLEIGADCISTASKNLTDQDASSTANSVPKNNKTQHVVDMETQTDHVAENKVPHSSNCMLCIAHKRSSQARIMPAEGECIGHYTYGLVTPPSDQPPYEHALPAEFDENPIVYAKIVRTQNIPDETSSGPDETENCQDEADRIAKVSNYSPSSVEDTTLEHNARSLPPTCEINETADVVLPVEEQKCNAEVQCTLHEEDEPNVDSDMEIEPEIETNAKEHGGNLNESMDTADVTLSHCKSEPATSVITEDQMEDIVDNNEGTSKNLDENDANQDIESNLVSESANQGEIAENLADELAVYTSTNIICGSPLTYGPPSNSTESSDVPSRSPCSVKCNNISSVDIPCTSTDNVTSYDYPSKSGDVNSLNFQSTLRNTSCASPDITSTSIDIQECHESSVIQDGGENQWGYDNVCCNTLETEEPYLNNESYCPERYIQHSECNGDNADDFKNNGNVSQSNLDEGGEREEIFIEDADLMHSEEEIAFIIEDALPIGANVNICMENSDVSSIHSDVLDAVCNEDEENVQVLRSQTAGTNGEGHVEPLKELKIAVEQLDMGECEGANNKKVDDGHTKIMYTSSDKVEKLSKDVFSKFQDTFHLRWNKLKETHNLDEIISGPVSKVNGTISCINPDTNFDLFDAAKAAQACGEASTLPSGNSPGNNPADVISPAYEEIGDDFRSYFEEKKNGAVSELPPVQNKLTSGPDKTTNGNKRVASIFVKNLKNLKNTTEPVQVLQKNENSKIKPLTGKRLRFAFAEPVTDPDNTVAHSPTENANGVLQSILKKSPPRSDRNRQSGKRGRPRIPRRLMNLKSLALYNVKPNDPCIQGLPCVIVERLSSSEITQWLRVSSISREIRLQKQKTEHALKQLTCRVDYDKRTCHINENDLLRYNTPQGIATVSVPDTLRLQLWRTNPGLQSNTSKVEEGMVSLIPNFKSNDYNNIPLICNSTCCSSLTTDLINLTVSKPPTETILNLSCSNPDPARQCCGPCCQSPPKPNPFLLGNKTLEKILRPPKEPFAFAKKQHNYGDILNLIQTDNAKLDSNYSHFEVKNAHLIQQPAIVPAVEKFQNTVDIEEVGKSPSLPSDLYNLNLSKFSPSPLINCFSPPSEHLQYVELGCYNSEDEMNIKCAIPEVTGVSSIETKEYVSAISDSKEQEQLDVSTRVDVNVLESEAETHLPLKKRKLSVANTTEELMDDDYIGPDLVEEIIKRARAEEIEKEDISYPAKPMISIAEIQDKLAEPHPRVFKTPAERKEMPLPPLVQAYTNSSESPRIVTEQYNNHTYNNPTINYHMNNVPYPFFPCASLPYFPPILLPVNSTTFDMNLVTSQQQPSTPQQSTTGQEPVNRPRRERRTRGRKKNTREQPP